MAIKRVWRRDFEDYLGMAFEVIDGRVVYHWKRDRRPTITALRGEDGKVAWERSFDRDSVGGFFPGDRSIYLEGLLAQRVSAETGETMAERDMGTRVKPWWPGPRWVIYRGSESPFLAGLSLETLDELWRLPDGREWEGHSDYLCSYTIDGTIRFRDLPSLRESVPVQGPPRELGGRGHVHVGDLWCRFTDKERVGIDVRDGAVAWLQQESDFGYHHTPVFEGSVAYSGDRGLSAYDLRNGSLLWRQQSDVGLLSSSPRVWEGRIYVGSKRGSLHVVDPRSGEVRASHEIDFEPREVVPIGNGRVVAASSEEVACFQLS